MSCAPTIDDAPPALNPHLDRARLSETFAQTGRVQVPNVLTDSAAKRVHHALEHETPWGLIFNEGKKVFEYETISAADYRAMSAAAWNRAHSHFQYFYNHYRLYENGRMFAKADHYLAKLVGFLTSLEFFTFIRDVTDLPTISWISSTATLYRPLDFLTVHDDGPASSRLVAFVLNLTPQWRPDWGGALQFYDRDDHIEEGYLPSFNTLNLFRVPQRHSVAQVAAFGGKRYSVSGWFGSEKPDQQATPP
jgi:Rps23 Pro-64 3,4-dihydroxylase Tpa1-like proline 4-hydroxylase